MNGECYHHILVQTTPLSAALYLDGKKIFHIGVRERWWERVLTKLVRHPVRTYHAWITQEEGKISGNLDLENPSAKHGGQIKMTFEST